jgi:hypothetical protein
LNALGQLTQEGSIIRKIISIRNKIKKIGGLPHSLSESRMILKHLKYILRRKILKTFRGILSALSSCC